jgi:hypothetical protein
VLQIVIDNLSQIKFIGFEKRKKKPYEYDYPLFTLGNDTKTYPFKLTQSLCAEKIVQIMGSQASHVKPRDGEANSFKKVGINKIYDHFKQNSQNKKIVFGLMFMVLKYIGDTSHIVFAEEIKTPLINNTFLPNVTCFLSERPLFVRLMQQNIAFFMKPVKILEMHKPIVEKNVYRMYLLTNKEEEQITLSNISMIESFLKNYKSKDEINSLKTQIGDLNNLYSSEFYRTFVIYKNIVDYRESKNLIFSNKFNKKVLDLIPNDLLTRKRKRILKITLMGIGNFFSNILQRNNVINLEKLNYALKNYIFIIENKSIIPKEWKEFEDDMRIIKDMYIDKITIHEILKKYESVEQMTSEINSYIETNLDYRLVGKKEEEIKHIHTMLVQLCTIDNYLQNENNNNMDTSGGGIKRSFNDTDDNTVESMPIAKTVRKDDGLNHNLQNQQSNQVQFEHIIPNLTKDQYNFHHGTEFSNNKSKKLLPNTFLRSKLLRNKTKKRISPLKFDTPSEHTPSESKMFNSIDPRSDYEDDELNILKEIATEEAATLKLVITEALNNSRGPDYETLFYPEQVSNNEEEKTFIIDMFKDIRDKMDSNNVLVDIINTYFE